MYPFVVFGCNVEGYLGGGYADRGRYADRLAQNAIINSHQQEATPNSFPWDLLISWYWVPCTLHFLGIADVMCVVCLHCPLSPDLKSPRDVFFWPQTNSFYCTTTHTRFALFWSVCAVPIPNPAKWVLSRRLFVSLCGRAVEVTGPPVSHCAKIG